MDEIPNELMVRMIMLAHNNDSLSMSYSDDEILVSGNFTVKLK